MGGTRGGEKDRGDFSPASDDLMEAMVTSEETEETEDMIEIDLKSIDLFKEVNQQYQQRVDKAQAKLTKTARRGNTLKHRPSLIRIGNYELETWYNSCYPIEYANEPLLFVCEFCLRYFRGMDHFVQHLKRCKTRHPPGNEIYRKDGISLFEVDGKDEKRFCQHLCLLGKCFINSKASFYDPQYFLFYILTKNDAYGHHFVGYFSKEKVFHGFALSCIAILPCYQGHGFGQFLIEISYHMMRRQGLQGTAEKPFSFHGRVTFAIYWRSAILDWFAEKMDLRPGERFDLKVISHDTGITREDVMTTLDHMKWLHSSRKGSLEHPADVDILKIDWNEIEEHVLEKARKKTLAVDEKAFVWQPNVYKQETGGRTQTHKTQQTINTAKAQGDFLIDGKKSLQPIQDEENSNEIIFSSSFESDQKNVHELEFLKSVSTKFLPSEISEEEETASLCSNLMAQKEGKILPLVKEEKYPRESMTDIESFLSKNPTEKQEALLWNTSITQNTTLTTDINQRDDENSMDGTAGSYETVDSELDPSSLCEKPRPSDKASLCSSFRLSDHFSTDF